MDQNRLPYISYMLRLWLENDSESDHTIRDGTGWRASLEDPYTQEIQGFADMEALFAFLLKETELLASGMATRPSTPTTNK